MPVGQPFDYVASVLSFGDRSTISAGLSRYLAAPGGTSLASELAVVAPRELTLQNLYWSCAASTLTGNGHRITLYLNGTATPVVATWNGGATYGGSGKGVLPLQITKGDSLSLRIQLAAGAGNITRPRVSVELALHSTIPWLSNGPDMYYFGGNVGIGTDSPGETLSVNGIVESITGGFRFPDGTFQTTAFIGVPQAIPPGSVIAYAGASAPSGWLVCDGSVMSRTVYVDLFAAIGVAHGSGDGSVTFNLPDFRGRFLRGVSGTSDVDHDTADRTAMGAGGNTGNNVGSVQMDQMKWHGHSVGVGRADSYTMVPGGAAQRLAHFVADEYNAPTPHESGVSGGGSDTRPRNAYVNFLIKA